LEPLDVIAVLAALVLRPSLNLRPFTKHLRPTANTLNDPGYLTTAQSQRAKAGPSAVSFQNDLSDSKSKPTPSTKFTTAATRKPKPPTSKLLNPGTFENEAKVRKSTSSAVPPAAA